MAKKSSVEKNKRRERLAKQFAGKRARLKALANDESLSPEEQFEARIKLAQLPRNSSPTRIRLPLRAHRPPARQLPQVQALPHQAA